jgi:hypothetical protein
MSRPKIVISVFGGVVQDVLCLELDARVIVVDWDAEGADNLRAGYVVVPDKFGRQSPAIVSSRDAEPLSTMKDTPIQAALNRAEFLYGKI